MILREILLSAELYFYLVYVRVEENHLTQDNMFTNFYRFYIVCFLKTKPLSFLT